MADVGAAKASMEKRRLVVATCASMPVAVMVAMAAPTCESGTCSAAAVGTTVPKDVANSSMCILPDATVAMS